MRGVDEPLVASVPGGEGGHAWEDISVRMSESWPDRIAWAKGQTGYASPADDADLDRWRDEVDPDQLGQFEHRLELDGLSVQQARAAFGNDPGRPRSADDWLPHVRRFLAACRRGSGFATADDTSCQIWLRASESSWPPPAAGVPFAHLMWPGARAAWSFLATSDPASADGLGVDAVDDLCLGLLSRLGELMAPTLQTCMNTELTYGQRLLARIADEPGDPSRVAYARTCLQLAQGRLDQLLVEHPVLPSLLGTVIRQWQSATSEMLARLRRHREELEAVLGVDSSAVIDRVHLAAGDRHNDGRSVAIISVGGRKIVYKPRDCRLERLWASTVASVNSRMADEGLRAPRIVLGEDGAEGHYGFAEFIENEAAASLDETRSFYRNAGRTLALLFALSATDCHFENLVAHRDQLILIDAEALFETRNARTQLPEIHEQGERSSVLQVGMLPAWLWLDNERTAVDISALGCSPGGTRRTTYRGWRAINTDAMARGHTTVAPDHPVSLPTPPGQAPVLRDWVDAVVDGFEDGYRAICTARGHGLTDLVQQLQHVSRRLIQRPTYVYAALLAQAREPRALRSITERGMVLERLTRAYLADESGRTWPLVAAEQRALSRLDVPLFEATLDGSLTRSRDVELVDWPGSDAVSTVLRRIADMGDADMRMQTRLIRASFAAHDFPASSLEAHEATELPPVGATRTRVAERCLRAISDEALRIGTSATWMTLAMLPDGERVNVQPVGSSLYDGSLGVSIFLHEAGAEGLADAAITPVIDQLDPDRIAQARRLLVGAGTGLAGAGGYLRGLSLMAEQGRLSQERADRATAAIIRAGSPPSLAHDRALDMISGVAGLITPLVRMLRADRLSEADQVHTRALVRAGADRLVTQQRSDGGWLTLPGSPPLTGLAHGAAGIALALMEAAVALDESRYADCATRGLEFENSQFDVDEGNWRDLRASATGPFMLGWCAGAPGIALTRMRMIDLLPEHPDADRWRADLHVAAATTAAAPLLARDHLCCGNYGRAAVLALLGHHWRRAEWTDAAHDIMDRTVARTGDRLPRSIVGADGLLAVPGLMTGLAGAGLLLSQPAGDWQQSLLL